jgi:hypothetical protein
MGLTTKQAMQRRMGRRSPKPKPPPKPRTSQRLSPNRRLKSRRPLPSPNPKNSFKPRFWLRPLSVGGTALALIPAAANSANLCLSAYVCVQMSSMTPAKRL